jgi:VanZ family protein
MLQKGKVRPFFWGVLAASVDETIQCFVPDRGPAIKDVCIDSAGVLTGIILLWMGYYHFKKRFTKLSLEDK